MFSGVAKSEHALIHPCTYTVIYFMRAFLAKVLVCQVKLFLSAPFYNVCDKVLHSPLKLLKESTARHDKQAFP